MKELSPEGLQLLLDGEVGGGEQYYDHFCKHPIVPDPGNTASGITIGIGFDVGQSGRVTLSLQWDDYLDQTAIDLLADACGLHGADAVKYLPKVKHLVIPWEAALAQFQQYSIPRFIKIAQQAFTSIDTAPQAVQEALLSLVYNRGGSMWRNPDDPSDRRREMRTIRDLVADNRWSDIPAQLRAMKRLWPNTKGLRNRRDAEARHIEQGLAREAS